MEEKAKKADQGNMEEKAKKADRGNMEEKADRGNLEEKADKAERGNLEGKERTEKEKTGRRQLLEEKAAKMDKLKEKKNAQIGGESKYAYKLKEQTKMNKLEAKGANQRQADETKAEQQY